MKRVSQGTVDARPDAEEAKIIQEMSECVLVGHSGDNTIRKWSLLTRSCLVVYLSH